MERGDRGLALHTVKWSFEVHIIQNLVEIGEHQGRKPGISCGLLHTVKWFFGVQSLLNKDRAASAMNRGDRGSTHRKIVLRSYMKYLGEIGEHWR